MKQSKIIIVGAGIGGLATALSLQRVGFRVAVYEQAAELGDVGAGLTVSPNATHALEFLGLGDVLAAKGHHPRSGKIMHWRTGDVLMHTQRDGSFKKKYGAEYYQIHRADLHNALVEAVLANDPGAIHLNHTLAALKQDGGAVTAVFENGAAVTGDVLIGADGLRSVTRALIYGNEAPRFTGQAAFRGLIPAERVKAAMDAGPSVLTIGPGHTFVRYYLRDHTLVNFVALTRTDAWKEEGWSIPATVDQMLETYGDWHSGVVDIIKATPADKLFKWALFDREPLPRWTTGRVTLLGDAAHPMLPFLGMGAAIALEDAVILARCFAESSNIDGALKRYEAARRPRATEVTLDSRRQSEIHQGRDPDNYGKGGMGTELRLKYFPYNPVTAEI